MEPVTIYREKLELPEGGKKLLLHSCCAPCSGEVMEAIIASGGAAQSELACQMLADSTGVPVALPTAPEPVLLGSAMLAAIASGLHRDAAAAMSAMTGDAQLFVPANGELARLHAARFEAFAALQGAARDLRAALR